MTIQFRNLAAGAVLLLAPALAHAQLFQVTKEQLIELTSQNPFDRFADGRPKIPDDLLERARGMSAEEVWAGLNQAGGQGGGQGGGGGRGGQTWRNQYEDNFQVLHPKLKLVSRAFTVQFMPSRPDLDTFLNQKAQKAGVGRFTNQYAIDMLQPGGVLVVVLFGKVTEGTMVGDNLFYSIM